jgi:hypothetical protein
MAERRSSTGGLRSAAAWLAEDTGTIEDLIQGGDCEADGVVWPLPASAELLDRRRTSLGRSGIATT